MRRVPSIERWRLKELLDEQRRRVGFSTLVILSGVLVAALYQVVVGAGLLSSSYSQLRSEYSSGAGVWVSVFAEDERVDVEECESLSTRSEQVLASGALFFGDKGDAVLSATSRPLPTAWVTPGALAVWWDRPDGAAGVSYGSEVAEAYALAPDVPIRLQGEETKLSGELPVSVAPEVLQSAVVAVSAGEGTATECWIRFSPHAQETAGDWLEAQFPTSLSAIVAPYLSADDLRQSPADIARTDQASITGLGLMGVLVLSAFVAIIDRRELGVYRVTGTSLVDLLAMWIAQSLVIAAVATYGVVIAVLIAFTLMPHVPVNSATAWYLVQPSLVVIFAGLTLSPVAYWAAIRGRILDQLSGR